MYQKRSLCPFRFSYLRVLGSTRNDNTTHFLSWLLSFQNWDASTSLVELHHIKLLFCTRDLMGFANDLCHIQIKISQFVPTNGIETRVLKTWKHLKINLRNRSLIYCIHKVICNVSSYLFYFHSRKSFMFPKMHVARCSHVIITQSPKPTNGHANCAILCDELHTNGFRMVLWEEHGIGSHISLIPASSQSTLNSNSQVPLQQIV